MRGTGGAWFAAQPSRPLCWPPPGLSAAFQDGRRGTKGNEFVTVGEGASPWWTGGILLLSPHKLVSRRSVLGFAVACPVELL